MNDYGDRFGNLIKWLMGIIVALLLLMACGGGCYMLKDAIPRARAAPVPFPKAVPAITAGDYYYQKGGDIWHHLDLRPDHYGLWRKTEESFAMVEHGDWRTEGNTLVLTRFFPPANPVTRIDFAYHKRTGRWVGSDPHWPFTEHRLAKKAPKLP